VIVSASFYETFGLTVAEGFLRGKPVLSTRSGGPEELIDESNGLLCEVNNVEELKLQLTRIYKNHGSYDSDKIRKDAVAKFSTDKLFTRLNELYAAVLTQKNNIAGGTN
jgi:L-malate glycosyltransferase